MIVADGNTSVTVTITLLDQYSNPVVGVRSKLRFHRHGKCPHPAELGH